MSESVQSVLTRLYRYYNGRAKSCQRISEDNPDAKASTEHRMATVRWEAKRDAVSKVAENLSIILSDGSRRW